MHEITSRRPRPGYWRSHAPQSDQSSLQVDHPPKHFRRLRDDRSKIFDGDITSPTVPQDIESSTISEVEPGSLTRVGDATQHVEDNVPDWLSDPHPTPWMPPWTPSEISQGPSLFLYLREDFQEHMDGTFGVPNYDPLDPTFRVRDFKSCFLGVGRVVCSSLSWCRNLVLKLK